MAKAILINSVKKTLTHVDINDLSDIYNAIGNECITFTCPFSFENGDALYVDDEGLLKNVEGGIVIEGLNPLIGNVIVIGTDDEGNDTDVKISIEELLPMITFLNGNQAKMWQAKVLGTPPIILSW